MKLNKIKEFLNKEANVEEFVKIEKASNKYLIMILYFLGILILVGLFILASPGILGEKPIAVDKMSYRQYKIIKKIKRQDNVTIVYEKEGQNNQIILPNEKVRFITDFDLHYPTLKIYDPRFIVMQNAFYNRELAINKENKKFKNLVENMKKRNIKFFIYELIDNE